MFDLTPFGRRNSLAQRNRNLFDIDDVFESFFNDRFFPTLYSNSAQMKVDIKETEKEYVLEAELPGISKDEVKVEIDDDRITITAQKNEQAEEEKDNYIRKERSYRAMTRSFAIHDIDAENIKAKYDNGILCITLPKQEQKSVKGKQIDIN
ncbi:MAG TPA: Hsp20/alpha crystallin family protein [Syntrophomonadaceae bacterium]|nr:Hsp20/alpha crystallin family protein [Syntrophomonadaceae bacterium]HPR92841.1 Hsp20/alpha crystallin family protein [Syntrophomonadaceae bacterium]